MDLRVISFQDALNETAGRKRHLLLGNGFSIALFPTRFRYGSLLEEADFRACPEAREAFDALGTVDFELVIEALRQAVRLAPLYAVHTDATSKMAEHAEMLKELLVQAIAGKHPERPSDITAKQYSSAREFLGNFIGKHRDQRRGGGRNYLGYIYTLNYDILLYWALLHEDEWGKLELEHDDGFRAPEDDYDAAYVTWEAEGAADGQCIHYLHGALHLFDAGAELQKKCWERAGGIPLVDQIRGALDAGKFPLYVAEGTSEGKLTRIRHSGYLQRSLKSFAAICRGQDSALFVFGHSLAPNDEHILRFIEKGKIGLLYVSVFGDPAADWNKPIVERARRMMLNRGDRFPLDVVLYDAGSAQVWTA